MFKFISKKTKQVTPGTTPGTITLDEQIYKDVYSAQELILQEAERILAAPSGYDNQRYQRLLKMHDLGFSGAAEVKEFKEMDRQRKKQAEFIQQINYYSNKYPLHRFISEEAVEKVCKKYGLLLTVCV